MISDARLDSASPATSLSTDSRSIHTVASSFAHMSDDDTEQVDPFMFGLSPRTLAFPGSVPPSPPDGTEADEYFHNHPPRSPVRPIIHIRTRSWGVHQMASPPPKTPLPPIPAADRAGAGDTGASAASGPASNMLAAPMQELTSESVSLSRPPLAGMSSSRLVRLSDITEEDTSVSGSSVVLRSSLDTDRTRSHSGSSAGGNQLDSFINFDHSSVGSEGDSEAEEQLRELPKREATGSRFGLRLAMPAHKPPTSDPLSPETPRKRKLSKLPNFRHNRTLSALEADRMPSFRRGSSAESMSSNEELVTPQDIPEPPHTLRTHKRSSSWTRFKDRLKGLGTE